MTVYGVKPPCLPSHHYHHDDDDDHEYREDGGSWEENEGLYIQPTAAVRYSTQQSKQNTIKSNHRLSETRQAPDDVIGRVLIAGES